MAQKNKERNSVDGSMLTELIHDTCCLENSDPTHGMACAVRLLRLRLLVVLVVLVRRFRIWTPSAAVSALLRARRRQPAKLATMATRHSADTASVTLQKRFFQKLHLILSHTVLIIPYHIAYHIPYHTFYLFISSEITIVRWRVNDSSLARGALRLGTASFTFSTSTTPLRPRAKALAYNQITRANQFYKHFADVLTGF